MFPTWRSGSVYIENVLTGNVVDVQGGVKASGRNVWPYSLNYTNAQIFRFSEHRIPERYGSNARRIIAYPSYNGLLLSAKTPQMVIAGDESSGSTGPGTIRPEHILPDDVRVVADPDRQPSNKRTLKNVAFSLEDERVLDQPSPISVVNDLVTLSGAPKQVWNILPVEGEEGTFFIEGADFNDSMVMEPLDFSSGGTLVLSSFTGSDLQKWRIRRTAPPHPTNLRLDNFEWGKKLNQKPIYKPWKWHYVRFVKGRLSWANPNPAVLAAQTLIVSTDSSYESVAVDPSRTSVDFKVDSSESAKGQEHCLSIAARSRWQSENRAFSDELCRTPDVDEPSGPEDGGDQGVAKVLVFNCHSDRASVRLWTYDLSTNSGVWQDHGTLGVQWDGPSCPSGPPKEIALEDGHVYRLVAIDCGDKPPNQMPGTCHRLTSANIPGGINGATISFTIS
jgi:hypothetical protein